MLAAGQVDAVFGYQFGQALTLEQRGFPVNVMPLRDYGVKFYGTVIYTSEQLLKIQSRSGEALRARDAQKPDLDARQHRNRR